GKEAVIRLGEATAVVVGLGGVGSFAFEALVRVGVGHMVIIDHDVVEMSNLNRQLVAQSSTLGKPKVEVAKAHALDINPNIDITANQVFLTRANAAQMIPDDADIIIDAIDSVNAKVELIVYAKEKGIPILSSMGTANKTDPTKLGLSDIYKTSVDPLAKVMRKRLKDAGIEELSVVYSTEVPKTHNQDKTALGSVPYVPSVAGLILAGKAVEILTKD
ncbi:MAG: ThiF family adenylyltransferase, partial [Eubacteriales bacterium]